MVFYLGFLPTVVEFSALSFSDVMVIAAIAMLVLGTTLLTYAFSASRVRHLIFDARSQNLRNRFAGSIMVTMGCVLAAKT